MGTLKNPISARRIRVTITILLCLVTLTVGSFVWTLNTSTDELEDSLAHTEATRIPNMGILPFPISVNPHQKQILDNPLVDTYLTQHLAQATGRHVPRRPGDWLQRLTHKLTAMAWYQNIASPVSRTLVIDSGERKEEVVAHFGRILGWNTDERAAFAEIVASTTPELNDGKFFPGRYITTIGAPPETIARAVNERFDVEVRARYTDEIEDLVPLADTLTIASLLEREAYDFEDMRAISGVIWNRLFIGMKLQIDASLQYAAGSAATGWWPVPEPDDKYLKSPFNTYKHEGLPPEPIANPSLDAIVAALNPIKTDCYFYFHDDDGEFHCSPTYEGHVSLLHTYYGQGK